MLNKTIKIPNLKNYILFSNYFCEKNKKTSFETVYLTFNTDSSFSDRKLTTIKLRANDSFYVLTGNAIICLMESN